MAFIFSQKGKKVNVELLKRLHLTQNPQIYTIIGIFYVNTIKTCPKRNFWIDFTGCFPYNMVYVI